MDKNILKIYEKNLTNQNESARMALSAGVLFVLTSKATTKEVSEKLITPFRNQYQSDADWRKHRGQHTRIPNAVRALASARAEELRLLIDQGAPDQTNIDVIYDYLMRNKLSVATINAQWTTGGKLKTPRDTAPKKTGKTPESAGGGVSDSGAIIAATPDYRPMIEQLKGALATLIKCSEIDTYRALIEQELTKLGYSRVVRVTRKKAA